MTSLPELSFRELAFDSPERTACVELRREVLRRPLGLDFTAEQLAAEHADTLLAAFSGGQPVGCLLLTEVTASPGADVAKAEIANAAENVAKVEIAKTSARVAKMRQVAVSPALQGRGIGRQLVAFAETWLRDRGFALVTLHARDHAIAFYLAQGYALEGEPFREVGLPHRKMRKVLR